MQKILYKIPFIALITMLFACGPDTQKNTRPLNEPDIDQDALITILKDDQHPIACYYFNPKSPDYGQGFLKKGAWLWANIPGFDYVVATGKMQDGYLVSEKIEAVDWKNGTKDAATTMAQVEKICQDAIDAKYPGQGFKLYKLHAFKTRLPGSTKYPIVIASEEQQKADKLTRLLVFGDSLSDVGRLLSSLKIFPDSPYFLGRFSNGPVWSDILQVTTNLSVQNRSKGGAVSDPNVDFGISEIISMVRDRGRALVTGSTLKFIRDFLQNKTSDKKLSAPDKTLIVLWVGGNDYIAKADTKDDLTTLINEPESPRKGGKWIARYSVRNILDQLRALYVAGGRYFLVGNLPNIGVIPWILKNTNYVSPTMNEQERKYYLSQKMTELSQYHNQLLKKGLEELQQEFTDAHFILFDAYTALENIMASKGPDGEENFDWGINEKDSFVDLSVPGKPPIKVGRMCYTGTYLGTSDPTKVCKDSRTVLFWDEIHPTAKGQCGIAFMIHKQLYEDGLIDQKPEYQDYSALCAVNYAR